MICRDVKKSGKVVSKGCGKSHRMCTAYMSCKEFVAAAERGRDVRNIREQHYHLCNGDLIYSNLLIDFFSI